MCNDQIERNKKNCKLYKGSRFFIIFFKVNLRSILVVCWIFSLSFDFFAISLCFVHLILLQQLFILFSNQTPRFFTIHARSANSVVSKRTCTHTRIQSQDIYCRQIECVQWWSCHKDSSTRTFAMSMSTYCNCAGEEKLEIR